MSESSSPEPKPLMRFEALQVGYSRNAILPPINLDIRPGEFLIVLGANGAGKSTWFRTALGLLAPVKGKVKRREPGLRVSYVPQRASLDSLLPMSARRVVEWGRLRGWSFLTPWASKKDRSIVTSSMETSRCDAFHSSPFADLSGGQQQRVLFAQLLASEAEIVFLDEPTASMDIATETEAYERLASLCKDKNMAVVVITHSIGSALAHAGRFLFLDKGSPGTPGVAVAGTAAEIAALPAFQRQFGTSLLATAAGDTTEAIHHG